jgi:hypothetical protein
MKDPKVTWKKENGEESCTLSGNWDKERFELLKKEAVLEKKERTVQVRDSRQITKFVSISKLTWAQREW